VPVLSSTFLKPFRFPLLLAQLVLLLPQTFLVQGCNTSNGAHSNPSTMCHPAVIHGMLIVRALSAPNLTATSEQSTWLHPNTTNTI
jgi:hypothetical protein